MGKGVARFMGSLRKNKTIVREDNSIDHLRDESAQLSLVQDQTMEPRRRSSQVDEQLPVNKDERWSASEKVLSEILDRSQMSIVEPRAF